MKNRSKILLSLFGILAVCFMSMSVETSSAFAAAGVGVYAAGDALLKQTKALPNGAASITSAAIDLGHNTTGRNIVSHEFLISAPLLNATQLPNTKTMTYDVVTSANSDMSSPTVVSAAVLVQTGADAAGDAAAEARFRLPIQCERYVGVKATNSGTGDASAASVVLSLKF